MKEYYEDVNKYKTRHTKIILIGVILVIFGYLLLCINKLDLFFQENLSLTIFSLIFIHCSPIFISNLYNKIKNRDIGEVGDVFKNFIISELIFIVISFNLIVFL